VRNQVSAEAFLGEYYIDVLGDELPRLELPKLTKVWIWVVFFQAPRDHENWQQEVRRSHMLVSIKLQGIADFGSGVVGTYIACQHADDCNTLQSGKVPTIFEHDSSGHVNLWKVLGAVGADSLGVRQVCILRVNKDGVSRSLYA